MKKKNAPLVKNELIHSESVSSLPSMVDNLIEHFTNIKKDAEAKGYVNITVDFETEYGYYDDCWVEIKVCGDKPLTVKEFVEGEQQCIKAK
jgi:hypothetical protein